MTKSSSIKTQKRTRPISSHLDRTSLVNKGFIIWPKDYAKRISLLRDQRGQSRAGKSQPYNNALHWQLVGRKYILESQSDVAQYKNIFYQGPKTCQVLKYQTFKGWKSESTIPRYIGISLVRKTIGGSRNKPVLFLPQVQHMEVCHNTSPVDAPFLCAGKPLTSQNQ